MTAKEKWQALLTGADIGPIVSPLCDKWCADTPYIWKGPGREPFAPGDKHHAISEQINMANTFGWDALLIGAVNFIPNDESLLPEIDIQPGLITTTLRTPMGNLYRVEERNGITSRIVKEFLCDIDDFRKMIWYTEQTSVFNADAALTEAVRVRRAVGEDAVLGTWVEASALMAGIQILFYHLSDYPDLFAALYKAVRNRLKRYLRLYRDAGFDYLFYVVPGTEWISPAFFTDWIFEEAAENIAWWRQNGGFTVWHTCGCAKALIDMGVYNHCLPDIFESLSEPPVGDIPSLRLAREKLDKRIITKGNVSLDTLFRGTPRDVRAAVRHVKRETEGHRHIIALSDNILTGTPCDNLKAFTDEARQ